jgi:hypothetical protein
VAAGNPRNRLVVDTPEVKDDGKSGGG